MIATKSYASNVVKGWNVDVPITFSIDGNTYNAYEGMTWGQWVNSPYDTFGMTCPGNVKGCTIKTEEPNSAGLPGYPRTTNSYVYEYTIIEENYSYSVRYIGGPIND